MEMKRGIKGRLFFMLCSAVTPDLLLFRKKYGRKIKATLHPPLPPSPYLPLLLFPFILLSHFFCFFMLQSFQYNLHTSSPPPRPPPCSRDPFLPLPF
jgi:hypothetical protein